MSQKTNRCHSRLAIVTGASQGIGKAVALGLAEDGYVASKFALVGLSESVFHEYARDGIRVTAICPGYVNTKMARTAGSNLLPSQMIQPQDILATIRWLLQLSPATCVQEISLECEAFA